MKFLALATLVASALATYHGSYGGDMSNMDSKTSPSESSGSYTGDSYTPPNAADTLAQQSGDYMDMGSDAYTDMSDLSKAPGESKAEGEMAAPAAGGKVHDVIVGGSAGLIYSPESVTAAVGDKINFVFMQQNHTVTQSTFDKPCVKKPDGVDSGFLPNPNNTMTPAPTFMYEVKTTEALWFYCKQKTGAHCGKGMVFSINPTAEKSQDMFKQMAMQQNGTAAASGSMTMSSSTASMTMDSSTASVTMDSSVMATMSATMTSADDAAATPPPANPADKMDTGAMVQGSGMNGNGDACSCTCLCAAGGFPQGTGMGSWGGFGGALPAQWGAGAAPAQAQTGAGAAPAQMNAGASQAQTGDGAPASYA